MTLRDAQLKLIRQAALKVAQSDTSCYPEMYVRYYVDFSPLMGHCGAMASLIKGIYGGVVVTGKIFDKYGECATHYWNRLPDGTEVDLTSCQFGGDGFTPLKKGRKIQQPKLTALRFILFADRVQKELANVPAKRHRTSRTN